MSSRLTKRRRNKPEPASNQPYVIPVALALSPQRASRNSCALAAHKRSSAGEARRRVPHLHGSPTVYALLWINRHRNVKARFYVVRGLQIEVVWQRPLSEQTQWLLGVSALIRNGRLSRARSNLEFSFVPHREFLGRLHPSRRMSKPPSCRPALENSAVLPPLRFDAR